MRLKSNVLDNNGHPGVRVNWLHYRSVCYIEVRFSIKLGVFGTVNTLSVIERCLYYRDIVYVLSQVSRAVNLPCVQILRIDRKGVIDDVIMYDTWHHSCKNYLLIPVVTNLQWPQNARKRCCWLCNFDLIGLLPSNHIVAYITMAYRSLWGNVQC